MAVPVPSQFDITFTAEIVAATTTDLVSVPDASMRVTAASPITVTSFGLGANQYKILQFDADITLTQSTALTLIPPVSRITVLNDVSIFVSDADGNWKETDRQNAAGQTENKNYYAQILADVRSSSFGGRLTLVSGAPVMTSDQTAKAVIYYTPYTSDYVSIYDSAVSAFRSQGFSEMSVTLDATNAVNAKAYDLFVALDGTTLRLGYGPAWTSGTARSAAISRLNGIWINSAQITLRYNSTSTFIVDANKASYVGSFYTTAAGQTGMKMLPTPTSGGTNNFLALYNAYNRIPIISRTRDTNWSYGTPTWRMANNSSANRVSWIDGLAESIIECVLNIYSNIGSTGLLLDATSGTPTLGRSAPPSIVLFLPLLGFHYAQAMDYADSSASFGSTVDVDGARIEVRLMM